MTSITLMEKDAKKLFESIKYLDEKGNEFWFARDLQQVLGYAKWENFLRAIRDAKISCGKSGQNIEDHFPDVRKMVSVGSGAKRGVGDIQLSRYACYLIAQNGDPNKKEIALAQTYFAWQTRRQEVADEIHYQVERIKARDVLRQREKEFQETLSNHNVVGPQIGHVRSEGDRAFFGMPTSNMKVHWGIPQNEPIADYAPVVVLQAKGLASAITTFNTKDKGLYGQQSICYEHVTNNKEVRDLLIRRGRKPEDLDPEQNVEEVRKKYKPLLNPGQKMLTSHFPKQSGSISPV